VLDRTIKLALPAMFHRVLSTDDAILSSNLVEFTRLLQPLGFSAHDVRQMLFKQPPFLVANPVTVAQKLEALGVSYCCKSNQALLLPEQR
jgi:hypothetical protein